MRAIRAWLADHPREAPFVLGGLLVAAVLVVTQLILPGDPSPAHGTPVAVVVRGAIFGFVVSLFAVGIVLVHRTMRFINFAQGAFGTVGVTLMTFILVFTPVPFPVAQSQYKVSTAAKDFGPMDMLRTKARAASAIYFFM